MGNFKAVFFSMSALMGEDYEDENLMENQIKLKSKDLVDLRKYIGPRKWKSKIIRTIQDEVLKELKLGKKELICPDIRKVIVRVLSHCGNGVPSDELIEEIVLIFNRLGSFKLHENTMYVLTTLNERNYIQGIISNTIIPVRYYANELTTLGINEYFYSIITSADIGKFKPHQDIFEFASESVGLEPSNVTFIADDLETDVPGALASKMNVILVNRYTTKPKAPEGVKVVYSIKDILDYLPPL